MRARYASKIETAAAKRAALGSFGDLGPGAPATDEWAALCLELPDVPAMRAWRLARVREQPQQATVNYGLGEVSMRGRSFSLYVQDDFRKAANLTLNLGLRYELVMPFVETNGRMANLQFAVMAIRPKHFRLRLLNYQMQYHQ
jgi:hypothetical protein